MGLKDLPILVAVPEDARLFSSDAAAVPPKMLLSIPLHGVPRDQRSRAYISRVAIVITPIKYSYQRHRCIRLWVTLFYMGIYRPVAKRGSGSPPPPHTHLHTYTHTHTHTHLHTYTHTHTHTHLHTHTYTHTHTLPNRQGSTLPKTINKNKNGI